MSVLLEKEWPTALSMPRTRYFEIESKIVGTTYAVWVTVPTDYENAKDKLFPAIYSPDGNNWGPLLGIINSLTELDLITPFRPFLNIAVGYVGEEAANPFATRIRDLVPANEPLGAALENWAVQTATDEDKKEYGQNYAESLRENFKRLPQADRFLRFLTDELHPEIQKLFQVDNDDIGLFGFSYGGLFTCYAAMKNTPLFRYYGAGSPGIMSLNSQLFKLLEENKTNGTDFGGKCLLTTACDMEMTIPSVYQALGAGFAVFNEAICAAALKGLSFTSRIVANETHMTGCFGALFHFLREYYSA